MRNLTTGAVNGRIILALSLFVLAACGAEQAGVIPSRDVLQGQARIVSSVVSAGGKSYVVDQLYTPSESNLEGIAAGPERHIWFTGDTLVGKSSIKSDMSEFFMAEYGNATSIVEGPDQNLWVTLYPGAIGRMSPKGHLAAFPLSRKLGSSPFSITNGPDNALWFIADASKSYIVRITLAGQTKEYSTKAPGSKLQGLTFGNDGKLWFTDAGTNKIGRMSATGAVTEFSVPTSNAGLSGICQGPDGKLWFLEQNANKVASVTPSGSFEEYDIPTPASGPVGIVAGPDGALWFTEELAGKIGRITTPGKIVELTLKGAYPRPFDITVGSDRNLWFTESESYGIMGRVDLHEVPDSDPIYSEISLSLKNAHPQLGVPESFPLSFSVYDLKHRLLKGQYPNAIHLTTSRPRRASLPETIITSSTSKVSVAFSGHYTDATIGANANGGGTIQFATVLPSAPREKELPRPGYGLTAGPGDTLWICLANGSIATYSKDGAVKVYHATTSFKEEGCSMLEGPDRNVWFTDYSNNRIGKITPQGKVTFVGLGSDASPYSMALGSDGALWFTESFPGQIGRLTTDGQLTTFKVPSPPEEIVAGPDGNLWYNASNDSIYKLTTSGKSSHVRSVYRLGGGLWVAYQHLWFYDTLNIQLDEMSTTGAIVQEFSVPNYCFPFSLTSGPRDSVWYVDSGNDCAARMTLSGKFTVVPTYSQKENPGLFTTIVVGPNKDLWFTETGKDGLGWLDPTTM
jgi:streptogramin lyase